MPAIYTHDAVVPEFTEQELLLKIDSDSLEILVDADNFLMRASTYMRGLVWIVCRTSLAAKYNPGTGCHEIILILKTIVSANRFSGVYSGEKSVVLKTYPSGHQEVRIDAVNSHDQYFDYAEVDAGNHKQFDCSHPGFKSRISDANAKKIPVNHIFYDGSRTLKIRLNPCIKMKVSARS